MDEAKRKSAARLLGATILCCRWRTDFFAAIHMYRERRDEHRFSWIGMEYGSGASRPVRVLRQASDYQIRSTFRKDY